MEKYTMEYAHAVVPVRVAVEGDTLEKRFRILREGEPDTPVMLQAVSAWGGIDNRFTSWAHPESRPDPQHCGPVTGWVVDGWSYSNNWGVTLVTSEEPPFGEEWQVVGYHSDRLIHRDAPRCVPAADGECRAAEGETWIPSRCCGNCWGYLDPLYDKNPKLYVCRPKKLPALASI